MTSGDPLLGRTEHRKKTDLRLNARLRDYAETYAERLNLHLVSVVTFALLEFVTKYAPVLADGKRTKSQIIAHMRAEYLRLCDEIEEREDKAKTKG